MPHSFRDRRAIVTRPRIDDCDRTPAGRNAGGASTRKPRRTRPLVLAVRCVSRSGIGPHEAFLSPCRWLAGSAAARLGHARFGAQRQRPIQPSLDVRTTNGAKQAGLPSPRHLVARVSHPRTRSSLACLQITITAGSGQHKAHRLFGPLPPQPSGPTQPPNLGTVTQIRVTDVLSTG
jgi:hypothetical protein